MTWGIATQEPTSGHEALQRVYANHAKRRAMFAYRPEPVEPPRPSREQLYADYVAEQQRRDREAWAAYMSKCIAKAREDKAKAQEIVIEQPPLSFDDEPIIFGPLDHIKLRKPLPREMTAPGYLRRIVAWVADRYGFTPEEIYGKRRSPDIVRARHLAIQMIAHSKRLKCMSLPEIGRRMGGRDHTTILHAARKAPSYRNARKPNPWQCR